MLPFQTTHLELGVCDYPEHVPENRWADHAATQKALGLRYVRIAEFAWSRMEPQPGQYDWAWLDRAIDIYAAAGLEVLLCTPTAAPPAWLVAQHPEILPHGRTGQVKTFGSRRHCDLSSPVYRECSRQITQAMAERYGQHPAVVGWQTDNEFGWGDTAQSYSPAALKGFHGWLEERYGTLDTLNEAWGNVFWSMEYADWTQIPLPHQAVSEVNPAHALDFLRFSSDQIVQFQAEQVALLRQLSPGRFITHNFMGFFSGFDHYRVTAGLDFASWDSYPTGTLQAVHEWKLTDPQLAHEFVRTGHPDLTGFNHDLYRGMLGGPVKNDVPSNSAVTAQANKSAPPLSTHPSRGFWVMEQQCGQVNWASSNPLPAGGAVQLWTAQAWAHGADVVSYFRWRAATMAQEVMHSGLLRHGGRPDRGYAEVEALKLKEFSLGNVQNKVALLHDYESLWLYNLQPHAEGLNYWAQAFAYYRALRALGVDVDIIHPDSDLTGYALVVAPALTLMTPDRARHLEAAAQQCRLVFGPRTAFRTASGRTPETGQFGDLGSVVGAALLHYDSLYPGMGQDITAGAGRAHTGPNHRADLWAESYELEGADALYRYRGGPLDGEAAVIRYGNVTVIGAHSESLISEVLRDLLTGAGLSPLPLPEGVRLSRRGGITLLQNWNTHPVHWQGQELAPVSTRFLTPSEVL
ncbi:beta-galactosidase [Deinococcus sp. Arct2-2]|uniref:beta-galactosidase n=1 Tax=Deinococcus sp. Arct2-2 TaxID=2568653 RepID=UPI0010A3AAC6|nr:beta-galactosidase [Deinococcus sp. Arct2-2]THF70223.1 beta-galactosidase [Deinococcus sp. Arct2-2]